MFEYNFFDVFLVASLTAPVCMYVIFHKPRLFYTAYLLLSTRMFGFLPMSLSLRVNAVMFFLHCAMILAVVALLLKKRKFSSRMVVLFLAAVFSLIAFGILYPYFMGFSNIRCAIVDGKEMFAYAALAYLAIHYKHFDFDYFLKIFCFAGVVLTIILIVGHVTGYCPPGYNRLWGTRIIKVHHNIYLSLAACLVASRILKPRVNLPYAFLLMFLLAGLFLQGHRSIVLTTLLAISLLWLVRAHSAIKFVSVLAVLPVLVGLCFLDNGRYYETHLLEPISELKSGEGAAISSRSILNAVRYEYIRERPLLGYGFIHRTSSLGIPVAERKLNRFSLSLSVVDSGYVDMCVRFGIVGTVFFCFVLGFLLLERFANVRRLDDGQLAAALFLSTYFLINYTWSVFTFGFGIICSCVVVFLLYHNHSTRYIMPVRDNRASRVLERGIPMEIRLSHE